MLHQKVILYLSAWGLCLLVALAHLYVVLNVTPSLAVGWYLRRPVGVLHVGDIVEFSVPDVYLAYAQETLTLLKWVAGVPGDVVCWDAEHMRINEGPGIPRYLSKAYHGLGVLQGCQFLGEDDVIVLGDHPRSVDSRYLGPLNRHRIRHRVVPLLTMGQAE